ncbi:lactadherin-like [Mya arenaria]|uniref:lactadherin-like n=1 Tax=Mya arenaria TaxID=6604 RepID=UPI0022E2D9F1|nr:lactadherin-like [Mya arenaria]
MEGIEIFLGICLGHICPTGTICASSPNGSKARYTCLQADNCNITKFCPAPYYVCKSPLGRLFKNGHVASHIVSSRISTWYGYKVKTYSPMLYALSGDSFTRHGGWVPSASSIDEFIMLNMTTVCKLTGISTQGTHYYKYWVRSYTLSYSQDCVTWNTYLNHDGLPKYFSGNNNRDTVISHEFDHAILAKCVRLEPKSWNDRIGVRLDFTGCPVE